MWELEKVYTGFWLGDLREGDHLEDLVIGGRTILTWIFEKWDGEALSRLLWLRKGASDRLL
jgi:hypothetical protein